MMTKGDRLFKVLCYVIMGLLTISVIVPFWLLITSSLTDEAVILAEGYNFFPSTLSTSAYSYLWRNMDMILKAYGITIFVTVFGTITSVLTTLLLAYPMSKKDLPGGKILTFLVVFTMLFNGGMVPTYLIYCMVFNIKNTVWSLIFPNLFMGAFNVVLVRSYYVTSVPSALTEAAFIDGATEMQSFIRIVLPLSKPIIATIALMTAIGYWNDWSNSMVYITKGELYSIQALLNRILQDIQYLKANANVFGDNAGEMLSALPSQSIRMAIAVVAALPLLVAYPFFQKYFVKGITLGGVKG